MSKPELRSGGLQTKKGLQEVGSGGGEPSQLLAYPFFNKPSVFGALEAVSEKPGPGTVGL